MVSHLHGENMSLQCILIKNLTVCGTTSAQFPVSSVEMEDLLPPLTWIIQLGIQNMGLPLGRKVMDQRQHIYLFLVSQVITDNFSYF